MYSTTVITNLADAVVHCVCVETVNSFDLSYLPNYYFNYIKS